MRNFQIASAVLGADNYLSRRLWLPAVLFLMILLLPNLSVAIDISLQPRMEIGIMYYNLESEASSSTFVSVPAAANSGFNFTASEFELSDTMPYMGLGGTVFLNRFFLDVSGQYAYQGEDNSSVAYSGYIPFGYDEKKNYIETSYSAFTPAYQSKFDRREMAVSLGYAFTPQLSMFAGYKWADTQINASLDGRYSMVFYDLDDDTPRTLGGRLSGHTNFQFQYSGPFIGAIRGWAFDRFRFYRGILTTSLALAYLEGKVKLKDHVGYLETEWRDGQEVSSNLGQTSEGEITPRFDTKGNSLGLMLSIGWQGETSVKGLSYFLSIGGYRYEFNAEAKGESNINEFSVICKGGLAYRF